MGQSTQVHIIGAGIAGLVAAINLEQQGYEPIIFEASKKVGGRLETHLVDGVPLDVGFQVLLEAYPLAKKYLDYDKLDVFRFKPGAVIVNNGKQQKIGDPLRDSSFLLPALMSNAGSISDKLKVFQLNKELKAKDLEDIFDNSDDTTSTLDYLKQKGFSDKIINRFFKPFFGGIFLEGDLKTSSKMFEFVYKMFGEGAALLPKNGIAEIAKQLENQLTKTTIHCNKRVADIRYKTITFENGETIDANFIIVATEPSTFIKNLSDQGIEWNACKNFYFKVDKQAQDGLIRIVADKNSTINNYHFVPSENANYSVVSATVIDVKEEQAILTEKVQQELKGYLATNTIELIGEYFIPKALPVLDRVKGDQHFMNSRLTESVFLAGDYMLNASLNAAMQSGERAAQAVIDQMNK